jgi:DNA-binding FrmR family transcriptional regulator
MLTFEILRCNLLPRYMVNYYFSIMQHIENSKALTATRKAQGISNKVMTMIEADEYCPDIIQQIDAVIGLLRAAKKDLLEGHLEHCLEEKLHKNRKQTIDELLKIYALGQK